MKLLSLLLLMTLLVSCKQNNNMVRVRTTDKSYYVDKTTISRLDNGCLTFKQNICDCKVTVCGSYTIEE